MSDTTQEEAHTGPIKTPKQLLLAVFFSFFVPVFIIIALVAYVVTDSKPAGSTDAEKYALGGITAQDLDRGVAERLRKVGTVEIRDANRPLANGETVYKAQCAACHATGAANAPKFGDAGSWANRIRTGFDALVQSALKGKGAMPAQAAAPAAAGGGKALYDQSCAMCHTGGVAGAPKLGDKAAWAPRIKQGDAVLLGNAIKGKGGMPPKGGAMAASDADIKAAVDYMVTASK